MDNAKPRCQLCEDKFADVLCDCCKHSFLYCDPCYKFAHKTDTLSAHKHKRITHETLQSLVAKGFLCQLHTDERYSIVCKTCMVPICHDCVLSGSHQGHELIPPGEYLNNLINLQTKYLLGAQPPLDDIAKCLAYLEEGDLIQKKYSTQLAHTINVLFDGLLGEIAQKKKECIKHFDQLEHTCQQRRGRLLDVSQRLMDQRNKNVQASNNIRGELEHLVQIWQGQYERTQAQLALFRRLAENVNACDLKNCMRAVSFGRFYPQLQVLLKRSSDLNSSIQRKYARPCPLGRLLSPPQNKALARKKDSELQARGKKVLWNTLSCKAYSNSAECHCYFSNSLLPLHFCAKLRINAISEMSGDWTHAIGLTREPEGRKQLSELDYALLINKTHIVLPQQCDSSVHKFQPGDVINLSLTPNYEITVRINNEPLFVAFRNVKGNYYLFCSLYGFNQEVEILEVHDLPYLSYHPV